MRGAKLHSIVLFIFFIGSPLYSQDRIQLNIFDGNRFVPFSNSVNYNLFNPELGSAVLIHGWNPPNNSLCPFFRICEWDGDLNQNNVGRSHWTNRFANELTNHIGVNVLAWDALEEYNVALGEALPQTLEESPKLAQALAESLPPNYSQALHVFGHSIGAFQAIETTRLLIVEHEIIPHQVTLFDVFDGVPGILSVSHNLGNVIEALRGVGVYIDLLDGRTTDGTHNVNVSINVPGAPHDVYNWYMESMEDDPIVQTGFECETGRLNRKIGFQASVLVTGVEQHAAIRLQHGSCGTGGTLRLSHSLFCSNPFRIGVYAIDTDGGCTYQQPRFRRGDTNNDGAHDVSDAIKILLSLFTGDTLTCLDAADVNDDGDVNITDPVYFLDWLFQGGQRPAFPYDRIGEDPTDDDLGCQSYGT